LLGYTYSDEAVTNATDTIIVA